MARKGKSRKAGSPGKAKSDAPRILADNRSATHKYIILEKYEAGIALKGTEIKSLREGRASLREAYASVRNGEAWLYKCHISEYSHKGYASHEPLGARKLLLHKHEINKLIGRVEEKGLTLIPLRIYLKRGRAKCLIGLAKGKKIFDHREAARRKIDEKEMRQEIKRRR